jgi:hypothetical protein
LEKQRGESRVRFIHAPLQQGFPQKITIVALTLKVIIFKKALREVCERVGFGGVTTKCQVARGAQTHTFNDNGNVAGEWLVVPDADFGTDKKWRAQRDGVEETRRR